MSYLDNFIADFVMFHSVSMFSPDGETHTKDMNDKTCILLNI